MTHLKALIIDDNPSDRALALREIKKLFPQLQHWSIIDDSDFSVALQDQPFNLVITDYHLRWTTGLDILRRIKEQRPDCPVIMFTGTGSEEIAVKAMKAGLDDYVIKSPKHYIRLAAAVRSAWQRSQQKQALKQIQQSYDRFFERVPLGLYRLNSSGEILEINSALVKILGGEQVEDLLGQNLQSYHLQPESYRQWQQQLLQVEATEEFEGQIRSQRGDLIWVRHRAIAIFDHQGNLICYEGALTDITANKQAEFERLELLNRERYAKEEAEKLNRIKDEFLATLSHELRTPLNAIIGWVQLLNQGDMSKSQSAKAISVITRNAEAQNQLIDDLLDVSRIIRGKMKLQLSSANLSNILLESIDTVYPTAEAKKVQIKPKIEPKIIDVKVDAERLQQVFWNLLINAIKFTPMGGSVTVSTEIQLDKVLINFSDTGQGIAPEILPYVFDRFRQAETKSSTRTKGGLGLGLAIVRHLLELHGGSVRASSPGLGKGATFSVELPLLNTLQNGQKAVDSNDAILVPSLKGLTLLIVEDEADAREMLTLLLEQYGAVVIAANSVKQALVKYQQYKPDVLISDISMPLEDGYDLIRHIRCDDATTSKADDNLKNNDVIALALTACAGKEDRQKALEAGFDFHLPKPIEPLPLVQSLTQLIHQKNKHELV
ncbi:MAG: response regulator [Cyanobacteria bacterium P01_A01_bin.83]